MEKIFYSSKHERLFKSRKSGFQNRLRINDFGLKKAKVDLQDVVVSATFLGLKISCQIVHPNSIRSYSRLQMIFIISLRVAAYDQYLIHYVTKSTKR